MNVTNNHNDYMYHFREAAITLVPGGTGFGVWLNNAHTLTGIAAGLLTCVWVCIRIAIAWRDYKNKK